MREKEYAGPKRIAYAELCTYAVDRTVTKYYLLGRQKIKAFECFYDKSGQIVKKVLYSGEAVRLFIPRINSDVAVRHYVYNDYTTLSAIHFGNRQPVKGRTVYNYF